MRTSIRRLFISAVAVSSLWKANAAEFYVAKSGSAEYSTLQSAVDAAADGDVIHVAEGVYDDYSAYESFGNCCLVIENKSVTIVADGAKAKTIIKGKRSIGYEHGMGANSVRGIVAVSAGTTVIEGFTIQECTTVNDSTNQQGGGFYDSLGVMSEVKIVDCDIYACSGTRAGAGYGGNFIRCRASGCMAVAYAATFRAANVFNSVVYGNKAASGFGIIDTPGETVNCTFAFNTGKLFNQAGTNASGGNSLIRNCIIVGNSEVTTAHNYYMYCADDEGWTDNNSVTITTDDLFSPASGDFRLKSGSAAIGIGNTAYPDRAPEGYRDTDLLGNARVSNGKINAGAVQSDATPVETGATFVSTELTYGGMTINGSRFYSQLPVKYRAESLPADVTVGFAVNTGWGFVAVTNAVGDTGDMWPMMDDTVRLHIAEAQDAVYGPVARGTVYVSPDGDNSTADGSETKPYATISTAASKEAVAKVVMVYPGTYETGTVDFNGNSRVGVNYANLTRIKAVEGPEKTIVKGADATNADEYGLGDDAIRCVALGGRVALQGFTLEGGRTYAAGASSTIRRRGGGVLLCDHRCAVLDCVITNCNGVYGAAVNGRGGTDTVNGRVIRTRIIDCKVPEIVDAGASVAYCADLYSSLFIDNEVATGAASSSVIGQNCVAYNCTAAYNSTPAEYGTVSSFKANAFVNSIATRTSGGVDLPWGGSSPVYVATNSLVSTSTKSIEEYADCASFNKIMLRRLGDELRPSKQSGAAHVGAVSLVKQESLCDVNGTPFDLSSMDGSMTAGCFADDFKYPESFMITIR